MSNKKEQDMLNEYPDLSDEDEDEQPQGHEAKVEKILPNSQPHKIVKPNQTIQSSTHKPVFTAPLLFGGKNFIPPPPPPGSRGKMNYSAPQPPVHHPIQKMPIHNPQNAFKYSEQPQRPERERKNCVFVKNIPKHYNQQQKLMTFFKNEGQVREIKVNHEESSAIVRFSKEQDSIKFINSNKAIFNRSFIIYSLNEKDVVPLDLIKERQNEEAGKIKKPIEVEMKQSRERLETVLADKIRALLYLVKNVQNENTLNQLKTELAKSIEQKNQLQKYGYQQLQNVNKMTSNEYDWTIVYLVSRNIESEKKGLVFDLQKKFGPISTLDVTPTNAPAEKKLEAVESHDATLSQASEYIVKLSFLSIKNCWEYYYSKLLHHSEAKIEEKNLQVQGIKLRSLFNEGMIKKPMIPVITHSYSNREEPKEELVEILENGQVRVIKQQRVIEPQVDQLQIGKPQSDQPLQGEPSKQGQE